ncbi:MAG: Eco57I restriction-modification methylase domain-containing protein [Anaerolineae bacterium]
MPQLADQLEFVLETHRNHFLFSDYYLDHRVRERTEWKAADARATFEEIAGLWQQFTPQSDNEAQTEYAWIRPVLEALGHTFNVQVSVRTPLGTKTPDYVFYPDETTRDAARALREAKGILDEQDLRDALAVGDAKAWDRPLDQPIRLRKSGRLPKSEVPTTSENPSFQIDFYIRHTGRPWGVLTNGRRWRLYHRDTSKKLDVYYEVDLPALIEQGDVEAFKYFYLFFRREAFSGDPPWLELVLEESRVYEQGVSEGLKEQVYEALRFLAQGFLDFPGNGPSINSGRGPSTSSGRGLEPTPDTLKAIYDNSLIVLYRLLFILYAESRGLLPVDENPAYARRYSLRALKERVARELDQGAPAVPSMDTLWHPLRQLWHVLNTGNPDLGVPAYNGGLFDPERHPFLERYRVGDLHLRQAIDLLARTVDPATGRREFVDYRDLEIRHLGSIYEGLLEYQLRYAEEPLAVRKERGREVYVQTSEVSETSEVSPPAIQAGQVYLVTDKGERKATGSYYTPDYIVQYIVEHAVGPVLNELKDQHTDEDGNIRDEAALVQAILGVNVLDPAMGSGHFLVATTDFIARYLVGLGLGSVDGMVEEGELAYWRRRVAQTCIYGADVNPLAVELAKLSLWLATVARDKPLSFLDHHLRCGNSLIGARVGELLLDGAPKRSRYRERKEREAREAGQLSMLDDSAFVASMRTATGFMDQIEALESETLEDVQEAERIYLDVVRDVTRKYRALADVWTARHFGLELDDTVWSALAQHVLRAGFEVPQYAEIIEQARDIAGELRFFNWELEFPEVFFDEHGRLLADESGFDAVIGNPPYGASLSESETSYLFTNFSLQRYQLDTYFLFIERGLELLHRSGFWGMIIPNTWLLNLFSDRIREYVFNKTTVSDIVHYRHPIFLEATVDTEVTILKKEQPTDAHQATIHIVEKDNTATEYHILQRRWQESGGKPVNILERSELVSIADKLRTYPVLDSLCVITQGCKPFQEGKGDPPQTRQIVDDKHFVSETPQDSTFRPLLRGSRIQQYQIDWNDDYWISFGDWLAEPRYSANYDAPAKIVIRQTGDSLIATLDRGQFIVRDNLYTIVPRDNNIDLRYVLTLLNSSLLNWFYQTIINPEEGEALAQVKRGHLAQSPVCEIEFTTPADTRAALLEKGKHLYGICMDKRDQDCVTGFVEHQLAKEPECADVVHDLLAFLAERMIELHKQRQRLEQAADPFKYLNRGVLFVKFPNALAEEIKYGQLVQTSEVSETSEVYDLGAAHHDIDGLRLVPAGNEWELQIQLKKRDPNDDWQSWQYADDGNTIAREWVPAYRLPLSPEKARYYRHAFQVLAQFANAKSFPGGYTRTTMKKLQLTRVPAFDRDADLMPLVELNEELAGVRDHITHTDNLIDQIVYRLYGLTEEEIAVVEGRSDR